MSARNAIELTAEANEALQRAEEMSQANRADTPTDRRGRYPSMPWLVALVDLLRGAEWGTSDGRVSSRWVLSVRDGDRPADLTDSKINDAATWLPEHRHRCRTHEGKALVWREMTYDRGRGDDHAGGVRLTHREVHPAIAGEPCPTCQWCRTVKR